MKLNFLYTDKHQYFLQVNFNTLDIEISYKIILSLLMGVIKHYQNTQSNKFAISLQYLKNIDIITLDGSGQTYPKYPK